MEHALTCKAEGCTVKLDPRNKTGFCRAHLREQQNGATRANAIVPLSSQPNGYLEDRLNQFLLAFPIAEKTRLVQAWLQGKV